MLIVRTPLRISLFGGGTDLPDFYKNNEFGSVLSFSIDKYIYLSIHPLIEDDSILLKYSKQEYVKNAADLIHPVARNVLEKYNLKGVDISVSSDIPAGTGLGSSSSFAVGFYNLIESYLGLNPIKVELARKACELEITTLSEKIGKQDQYACAVGGINRINFLDDETVHLISCELSREIQEKFNEAMIMIRVGKSRSASVILRNQSELIVDEKTNLVNKYLSMREFVPIGEELLRAGNFPSLGELISQSWELKKQLSPNISNTEIDAVINICLENGAYGAKLLGAGGGGYVLVVGPENAILKITSIFSNKTLRPSVDFDGSTVIYNSERI